MKEEIALAAFVLTLAITGCDSSDENLPEATQQISMSTLNPADFPTVPDVDLFSLNNLPVALEASNIKNTIINNMLERGFEVRETTRTVVANFNIDGRVTGRMCGFTVLDAGDVEAVVILLDSKVFVNYKAIEIDVEGTSTPQNSLVYLEGVEQPYAITNEDFQKVQIVCTKGVIPVGYSPVIEYTPQAPGV